MSNNTEEKQFDNDLLVKFANEIILEILGEEKSKLTNPQFLKNRTLTINCLNSEVAQEIMLNQAKIVKEMNNKMGENLVDRIRYLL